MKRPILFTILALVSAALPAQNMYSFLYHDRPGYIVSEYSNMQQRDGDFVISTFMFEAMGNHLGNMFYKISPTSITITDSLLVADTAIRPCILARNPFGEGNIRANFEYHEDCDSTFLRIQHFTDADLIASPEEDIVAPLCDGYAESGYSLLDCRGDLIMQYLKPCPSGTDVYEEYVVRFGLDGTLKHHVLFSENMLGLYHFHVLTESPLQYYQFKPHDNNTTWNLSVIVADSLFQKNTIILNRILRTEIIDPDRTEYEYFRFNYGPDITLVPAGGDDVLVAAPYVHDTNFYPWQAKEGIAVAKYDLRTMQVKGYAVFDEHDLSVTGTCLGLKMMTDGTVYFAYQNRKYTSNVHIVKMDANLNVEWNRLCKTNDVIICPSTHSGLPVLYEDGQEDEQGIAWYWPAYKAESDCMGWVYFILNHDGTVGTNDMGIEVRPYAFYPNPAQDQLFLQYSPDVEPAQIELYDLQGRLVRSQGSGLESLSLQGLAPGQYVMKVTMTDGTTFSDKVVKE